MNNKRVEVPKKNKDSQFTVFVVDDDPVTRRLIKVMFERNGYGIETAGTAEEALLALNQKVPNLLILDVVLPGASGFDLCREIKQNEQLRRVPVVFLTGQNHPQDYKEGHDSGAMMYVPKPVKEDSLLRVAQMLLPRCES